MKVGIIGAGNIAGIMAKTLAMIEHQEGKIFRWAIASRELSRAEAFAEQYGFPRAYGSYEELLNDPEVDLVYIATPHSHHYEHMRLCIEHGKPVLCEKAFTATAAQAEEILKLAQEKKVFVAEAIWTRYQPMRQIVTEVLESGIIGTPHFLTGTLGYPSIKYERLIRPELAGGALLDLGVYLLNFAAMFFGGDIVRASSVATLLDTGVDAQESITLEYSDGRLAILGASILSRTNRTGVICGTRGRLEVSNVNTMQHLTVYDLNDEIILARPCPPMLTGYEYEVQCCAEALANGWLEHPLMPHREILRIMRQMDELRHEWGVRYQWD